MRVPFRHYLAVTTVSVFFLMLLGVYTGKVGAGLACEGRWPLCDGWMGLFPANWPSFVEWFHRFVAMIVGFMIIGAGVLAYRRNVSRYIRYAVGLAVVVLPFQIIFGANTVLNFGLWESMIHNAAAQIIFAALVFATALAYLGADRGGGEATPATQHSPAQADD